MEVILVGYSGHAYVVADILIRNEYSIIGYTEKEKKTRNPFHLDYLGREADLEKIPNMKRASFVVGIGNNKIRAKLQEELENQDFHTIQAVKDPSAIIGTNCSIGNGSILMPGVIINAMATVGKGCIINSRATVEHECAIGDYTHIAPGAILAGNVKIGKFSFIGAGAVVREGIKIGNGVIVGAGSVVVKDLPDNVLVKGVPAK